MLVIGMTGPIGHGKTAFANALGKLEPYSCHLETSQIISEVANAMHAALAEIPDPRDIDALNSWLRALPSAVSAVLGITCTFEQLKLDKNHPNDYQKLVLHIENLARNPRLAKQAVTPENKDTYRPFLQWLGGYLIQRIDVDVWYTKILAQVREAESAGCQLCIVGGVRFPSDAAILHQAGAKIVKVYRPDSAQADVADLTERERNNIQVDCTVVNNGTLENLESTAAQLLKDLKAGKVEKLYQAKNY